MNQLEHDMVVLHRLFQPWLTAPHGTAIWEPEESDQNAQFKRDMIAKANEVIAAGDAALAGGRFIVPQFGKAEFDAIEESRRGQSELSASLGERVRQAVEQLIQTYGERLAGLPADVSTRDIYVAATRVVRR